MTRTMFTALVKGVSITFLGLAILSCKRDYNDTGLEYAPQMYNSGAYEPLNQITDPKHDYYNSNPNNPYNMTMREPVKNTVKVRNYSTLVKSADEDLMIYHISKDSFELAGRILKNPIEKSEAILADGKVLYGRYCQHCHGETGQGDGTVGQVYKGVPSYNKGRVKEDKEGHIFHTITFGRNRMWSHASQVSVSDRWKIVHYVQYLQSQE